MGVSLAPVTGIPPAEAAGIALAGGDAGPTATCTILFRTAYSTNSLTECSPSFRMILLRWVSAVFTLRLR